MNTKQTKTVGYDMLDVRPFNLTEYLQTDENISEYLSQVLAGGDTDELIRAVGYVAKARGMAQIAEDSGLRRASLYKALAPDAKPRFDTVVKVIRAMGVELNVQPAQACSVSKRTHRGA